MKQRKFDFNLLRWKIILQTTNLTKYSFGQRPSKIRCRKNQLKSEILGLQKWNYLWWWLHRWNGPDWTLPLTFWHLHTLTSYRLVILAKNHMNPKCWICQNRHPCYGIEKRIKIMHHHSCVVGIQTLHTNLIDIHSYKNSSRETAGHIKTLTSVVVWTTDQNPYMCGFFNNGSKP